MSRNLRYMRQAAQYISSGQYLKAQLPYIAGTWYFVDAKDGSANRSGQDPDAPLQTLAQAYDKCTSGRGDGICVFSRSVSGTAYGTAETASIAWSKYGITVVGIAAPTAYFSRARVTNGTATSLASLITVTGENNSFLNLTFYNGGSNAAALGSVIVAANRNYFADCHMNTSGAAAVLLANCSSLDLRASECVFDRCSFGTNSVTYTPASGVSGAILMSTTAQGQNLFRDCRVYMKSASNNTGGINIQGAGTMNGYTIFDNCLFVNFPPAGGPITTLTSVVVGTVQTDKGALLMHNCGYSGYADWCAAGAGFVHATNAAGADVAGKGFTQNPS